MLVQERSVNVLQPGEGRATWVIDALHIDKLTGEQTNGGLFVFELRVPPGGGPPPHIHHAEDEIFYVLRGTITFFADGAETELAAGGCCISRAASYIPFTIAALLRRWAW